MEQRIRPALLAFRALGIALAVLLMEGLAQVVDVPYAQVPFITSIVLVMSMPEASGAKPRALIGGHLLSTLAGLIVLAALGSGEAQAAIAVAIAGGAMLATRTLHPPAGLDAFLVVSLSLSPHWLLVPVFAGSVLLAVFSRIWSALGDRLFSRPTLH